jgi:hypothetical protein
VRLIRTDPWGYPLVHPKGAFVVVLGPDRRETGTHYTPKSLTERIVEETLTPLVYDGPAKGAPRAEWKLKTPEQLLDLKVCDPAMGSGAFLVQACRFLSARLVEAWAIEEAAGRVVDLTGQVHEPRTSVERMPAGEEARAENARRIVAERCLYGVDLNPLAVELAKLSLWLVTLSKGRPFGFLDHNLRCGDSLLGISRLEQLTELLLDPAATKQGRPFGKAIEHAVAEAVELHRKLHEIPIRDIRDVEAMATLDADARKKLEAAEVIADALIGELLAADGYNVDARVAALAIDADRVVKGDPRATEDLAKHAAQDLAKDSPSGRRRQTFHWPLEFPDVVLGDARGFDAIVGNPPWVSYAGRAAQPLADCVRRYYSNAYRSFARYRNLQGLFIERSGNFLRAGGRLGLVIPSSMAEQNGYAPVRAAHDCFAICDRELPNLPENTFRKVNQPSMILYSTARATRLEKGSERPWPMARPDLDAVALAAIQKLDRAPLPAFLFGERGLQTSGEDTDHLAETRDAVYTIPLRVGGDIQAFRRGPPSQYADGIWFGDRLRAPAKWKAVRVLIRQTARVPIAALSDGVGFRNSILAGFDSVEYPAEFLVAYLNSTPIRWLHYFRNRDARFGMPQMKIGHLRAIPAPPPDVVSSLTKIGRTLSERNDGVTLEEQQAIDRIVARGFGLSTTELERMQRDSDRWETKTGVPTTDAGRLE